MQLLKVVFEFLECLPEDQLRMLAAKKAKLYLKMETEKEIKKVSEPITQSYLDDICNEIENFTTRGEAIEYINRLTLLKADLKIIAKKYNIPLGSKETNSQIVEKIVENIVGSKLKFDALLNTNLK